MSTLAPPARLDADVALALLATGTLAGGTVLFSYGSQTLRRLLDLTSAGWPALTVTADGLEIAATCTVAELYAFAGAVASPPARPPVCKT